MRDAKGITLVELLIAMAILGAILAALSSLLVTGSRAQVTTARIVDRSETSLLVRKVLDYHLRLAGYLGADAAEQVGSLCGRTLEVSDGGAALTVRYFEDRTYGADSTTNNITCVFDGRSYVVSHITFSAEGGYLLQGGESVIDGVESFEVVELLAAGGHPVPGAYLISPDAATLATVRAVTVHVVFADGSDLVRTVPLVNRQAIYPGSVL